MDVLTDSVGIEYFNVVVYDKEINRLRAQRVDRPIFIHSLRTRQSLRIILMTIGL